MAHLRTHYNIKPFQCSYCNKSFNEKGNLKTHIRIHTGERPFKCKKCQKGFKALGQLKDHLISHTGFKPFQCPHCKKFYRRKEILKNHVIIHAKEPYFRNNKDKFQEILNNVKNMKNIIHHFDNSHSILNNNSNENIFNCTILTNDELKINLNNINIKENKLIKNNRNIFIQKKTKIEKENDSEVKNKINITSKIHLNNDFIINSEIFKDGCCMDWPNSLNSLNSLNSFNDIMSSTADLSLKEENNNIENKEFSFEKMPNMAEKENIFSLKENINNYNLYSNKVGEQNFDENDDCCSKMTNLYAQEYKDTQLRDYLFG